MKSDSYYPPGTDLTFVPVTHDEEKELFRRAKAGDADAKEKILRNHLLLVATIARRIARGKLPEDEIVSAANFALVKAYEGFDSSYPNRFSAFLKLFVRGEIARLWSNLNIVRKSDYSDGVPVTSVEITDDVSEEEDSDEKDHKEFLLRLIEESKSVLDPREKEIVGLLYCETPATQAEVARQLGISRERIRQIYDAALEKLRKETRRLMNIYNVNQ